MTAHRTLVLSLALLAAPDAAAALQLPPIRPLGPVVARASDTLGRVVQLRHLSDGRVLVNDVARRRVLLLDSALATAATVADSTSATGNAYGSRMGGLIAYRGDSTLFVDPQSLSMLVIAPDGAIARVMSVPSSQDAVALAAPMFGSPAFDAAGRLVYRSGNRFMRRPGGPGAGGRMRGAEQPDTVPLLRIDLATRAVDTVAFLRIQRPNIQVRETDDGRVSVTSEVNPLPVVDEWAVLADGSVAIVRGRDYHVDWVRADGSRESSPRVPFQWQRLTDEDKVAFIDSVQARRERAAASEPPAVSATREDAPGGGTRERVTVLAGPVEGPGGVPGGPQVTLVSPSELPDYKPPFFPGAVRADGDGNLWVRTIPTRQIAGGPVYDVIDARGALVDRVQVPEGREIVGFGRGGVVYLAARDGGATVLERARVR